MDFAALYQALQPSINISQEKLADSLTLYNRYRKKFALPELDIDLSDPFFAKCSIFKRLDTLSFLLDDALHIGGATREIEDSKTIGDKASVLEFLYTRHVTHNPTRSILLQCPTTYGIELEFFGLSYRLRHALDSALKADLTQGNNADWKTWEVGWDRSIDPDDDTPGIEISTGLLRQDNLKQLQDLAYVVNQMGGRVRMPCAMHVHAGITNSFPEEKQLPILKQLALNQHSEEAAYRFLDSALTHPARNYLITQSLEKRCDPHDITRTIMGCGSVKELTNIIQPQGYDQERDYLDVNRRRAKINMLAMEKHGTAEFREHPGTTDPNEIMLWLECVDKRMNIAWRMIENANEPRLPDKKTQKDLARTALDYVEKHLSQVQASAEQSILSASDFKKAMQKALYAAKRNIASEIVPYSRS